MDLVLTVIIIYMAAMFVIGCIIGPPDEERNVNNSIAMGITMIVYPVIIIGAGIKKVIWR